MRMSINSRKAGKVFNFWAPDNGGYLRLESEGKTGTLGKQLCHGGLMQGVCLTVTPENFNATCRKWYKHHIKREYD